MANILDSFKLNDRVVVVTGGGGFIAKAFAGALLEAGARVVLADINQAKAARYVSEFKLSEERIISLKVDVTNETSVKDMVSLVCDKFGRIDILVNNAYRHIASSFEERTLADFERLLKINLTSVFLCSQAVVPVMKKNQGGNIINMGSIYGVISADPGIYGDSKLNSPEVYAASKGGIINLTRYLAVHLAKYNIRVNCISPAGVYNNQSKEFLDKYSKKVPLGRMAKAEEIAGALVYLASDAATYVTGHNLLVDGGVTAW